MLALGGALIGISTTSTGAGAIYWAKAAPGKAGSVANAAASIEGLDGGAGFHGEGLGVAIRVGIWTRRQRFGSVTKPIRVRPARAAADINSASFS
jgi:hypothetical protein